MSGINEKPSIELLFQLNLLFIRVAMIMMLPKKRQGLEEATLLRSE